MSAIPTTSAELPTCTRTTVIDHLFRNKYKLTLTQTIILSYLLLLKNWANVVDGYFIITTNKIENDLKIGKKTIEASLTKLKKLGLVETKLLKVEEWNSNANFRALRITEKGKEYNLSYYKPKEHQLILELEEKNSQLEKQNKTLIMQIELNKESKIVPKPQEKNPILKKPTTPKKLEDEKSSKNRANTNITHKVNKDNSLEEINNFRKKISYAFSKSGNPICNGVENQERWLKETTFYINSYQKLSVDIPDGDFKQVSNPKQVNNFWEWLFKNQDRVGDIIDYHAIPNISFLLIFLGKILITNNKKFIIHAIHAVKGGGVNISLKDENGVVIDVISEKKSKVLDIGKCRDWFNENCVIE